MLATPAASRRHKDLLIAGHGAKTRFPIVLCALVRDCRTMTAVSTRAMIPIFRTWWCSLGDAAPE